MAKIILLAAILLSLLIGGAAGAATRNRTVVISDLHMNVDASYSWLKTHASDLAQFLRDVYGRDDVAEVLILGDLLDDWVCPVKDLPNTFADIIAAPINSGIVAALQNLCAKKEIKVTYVVGNHDMLSFLESNKSLIQNTFPGLNIISESPGMGVYTKDNVVWAEHGHRYTLFNAPDTWSHTGSHLPLGYFISRLAASGSIKTGQMKTSPDLLDQYVKSPSKATGFGMRAEASTIWDDAFVIAVFNAIALDMGLYPWDRFRMDGLDGFSSDPSVEGVAFDYDSIVSDWPTNHDRVPAVMAILDDLGSLSGPANLIFEMPDYLKEFYPFTPRIILFGHTHEAEFQYHAGPVETIYVNTGTWIDTKPMTWVEIEINEAGQGQKVYQVELWYYGESTPKQSGAITASAN